MGHDNKRTDTIATMRLALILTASLALTGAASHAYAYDDGAPWGAGNPSDKNHCASCHWERVPQQHSPQITLKGLPDSLNTNTVYALDLIFDDPDMQIGAFQMLVLGANGSVGKFTGNAEILDTTANGAMIRSRKPETALAGRVRWRFAWQSSAAAPEPPVFYVAVIASNNDGSAFGDTVHYRRIEFATR
ncbi:MAG: choice-of-anchor V domain-containing protein [Pseudomonadota bacterium]